MMFARLIAVDFDFVSKNAHSGIWGRMDNEAQCQYIVTTWFWRTLQQSYQGIDGQIVMKDKLLDSLHD